MTPKQLNILRHALGLDDNGAGTIYRNRFVVGPGCDSFADCQLLVRDGFMRDCGEKAMGGMHFFEVAPPGVEAVVKNRPILS